MGFNNLCKRLVSHDVWVSICIVQMARTNKLNNTCWKQKQVELKIIPWQFKLGLNDF